jgi:hypothetical protein
LSFKIILMKKFVIPIMILAIFVAFYQQKLPQQNVYVTVICVVIFMLGMMKLSAKIPPKDDQDDNEKI